MTRKFNLINPEDTDLLPVRATKYSAGFDFKASEDYVIEPDIHSVTLVRTGVTIDMPSNEYMTLYNRSSNGVKRQLVDPNGSSIIDADYKGEIIMPLSNYGKQTQVVKRGERIAQGIFDEYRVTDDDNATGTRNGGFGSTGV